METFKDKFKELPNETDNHVVHHFMKPKTEFWREDVTDVIHIVTYEYPYDPNLSDDDNYIVWATTMN